MLQFIIANKIFALQPCTTVWSVCYRFPSESALCRTLDLAPYISSVYVPIYDVKQRLKYCQMTLACERLSETRGGHGRFDFESGFSFRDLLFGVKFTLN